MAAESPGKMQENIGQTDKISVDARQTIEILALAKGKLSKKLGGLQKLIT